MFIYAFAIFTTPKTKASWKYYRPIDGLSPNGNCFFISLASPDHAIVRLTPARFNKLQQGSGINNESRDSLNYKILVKQNRFNLNASIQDRTEVLSV